VEDYSLLPSAQQSSKIRSMPTIYSIECVGETKSDFYKEQAGNSAILPIDIQARCMGDSGRLDDGDRRVGVA
jgi:hypothetical protein